jgi:cell fate (sporulation/competence/biofilm development) regulator YlbF (YheA/YmcA/DUF963 family)
LGNRRKAQPKSSMQTERLREQIVRQKTIELCQAIVQGPDFQSIRRRVELFMADSQAQNQYQSLSDKGRQLQMKQDQGLPLDGAEIAAFDTERAALFDNPVARQFVEAQQQMHHIQEGVAQYVSKTFELGRVPEEEDFQDGSCGHGCGCHHH